MKTIQIHVSTESFESIRQNRRRWLIISQALSVSVGDILILTCLQTVDHRVYNDIICRSVTEITPSDDLNLFPGGKICDFVSVSPEFVGFDFP